VRLQFFIFILHTNELFESPSSHSLPRRRDVDLCHSSPPDQHCVDEHPKSATANTIRRCNQPRSAVIHTATSPPTPARAPQRMGRFGAWAGFPTRREGVCPSPSCHRSSFEVVRKAYGIPLLVDIYAYFQRRFPPRCCK